MQRILSSHRSASSVAGNHFFRREKQPLSDFSKSILYRQRWSCSPRPLVTVHVPFSSFQQRPSLATSIYSSLFSIRGLLLVNLFARLLLQSRIFLFSVHLKRKKEERQKYDCHNSINVSQSSIYSFSLSKRTVDRIV